MREAQAALVSGEGASVKVLLSSNVRSSVPTGCLHERLVVGKQCRASLTDPLCPIAAVCARDVSQGAAE